jgi:tetratricopeptide (TPR) repeat protein
MNGIWVLLCITVGAAPYNQTFDRAAAAYSSGDFATAVQLYEQLIGEGVVHPAVFYNLGNAYYRQGGLGSAIANYERALQCNPGLESAAQNLEHCIRNTERRLPKPSPPPWGREVFFWHYRLPPQAAQRIAVGSWVALWVLLAARQFRPARYLVPAAIIAGAMAGAFGLSAWFKAHAPLLAVAGDSRVPVRYGASDDEAVRFELYEGDRVTMERRENGWARVATSQGDRGWARETALVLIGPPYHQAPAQPEEAS